MRSPFSNTSLSQVGVYGISVATDLDLIPHLPPRSGAPDLHVVAAEGPAELANQDPFYSSPTRDPDSVPAIRLYRAEGRFVARFVDAATFSIGPERIEYLLHDDTYARFGWSGRECRPFMPRRLPLKTARLVFWPLNRGGRPPSPCRSCSKGTRSSPMTCFPLA